MGGLHPVSEELFYIANVLPKINCLDLDNSKYKIHPLNGSIWRLSEIVIDSEKADPDLEMFRLGEDPKHIIFRSDLVEKINARGFTGLSLCEMGEELP